MVQSTPSTRVGSHFLSIGLLAGARVTQAQLAHHVTTFDLRLAPDLLLLHGIQSFPAASRASKAAISRSFFSLDDAHVKAVLTAVLLTVDSPDSLSPLRLVT